MFIRPLDTPQLGALWCVKQMWHPPTILNTP